jgi:long-chain acyl-CoA synthetase
MKGTAMQTLVQPTAGKANNLVDLLRARAERWPDAVALGSEAGLGWETVNSRELLDRVLRLADELRAAGVQAGDRVVIWAPNRWWTPAYLFALWEIGAIAVPFDREMNPEAASAIVTSVDARLVITGYGETPVWGEGHPIAEWWEPGSVTSPPAPSPVGEDGSQSEPGEVPPEVEGLAAIFYTSGTTGNPKGCMITHANLLSQVEALRDNLELDTSARLASILPLSHLFELTCGLLYPLAHGAAIHYIPSRRAPDILRVFNEQHISHMVTVPQLLTLMGASLVEQLKAKLPGPAYNALIALADRTPFPLRRRLFFFIHRKLGGSLAMVAAGGAALPPETQVLWERIGVRIIQGYGASETSPVIACGNWEGSPLGSVGKPIRDVQVRLTADGELEVKGPNVMRGYWRDPERTAEVLNDGWYSTGDIATIDPEGNIRLSGRAKDLIVLPSGLKVWPSDVEDVLRADPAVKDAAVVLRKAAGGATIHAFLLPAGAAVEVGPIVAAANSRLAVHQRISSASWYPEADFPRTAGLGKVRRQLLPEPEAVASIAPPLVAGDDVGQVIASVAQVPGVRPEQKLGDLGFDSLGLVNLALALEARTGKAFGDGDLTAETTVDDIRRLVAGETVQQAEVDEDVNWTPAPWTYTHGAYLRKLGLPFELVYRLIVTRTLISGREHLANLTEPVMFAGTHHGFADAPIVIHALKKSPARRLVDRIIIPAAAIGFNRAGIWARWTTLAYGLYPIRQFSRQAESLRGLADLARKGSVILIFPQGNHVDPQQEIDGEPIADFRTGVARLAETLGASVVPFGLAGTEQIIPSHVEEPRGLAIGGVPIRFQRMPLAIAFGAPLRLQPGETIPDFTDRLQAECFALTRKAEAALASA